MISWQTRVFASKKEVDKKRLCAPSRAFSTDRDGAQHNCERLFSHFSSGRAGSCAELDEPVGDRELVRWVEVLKRLTFDGVVRHTKHVAQLLWIDGQPSRAAYCRILLLLRLKPNRTWSSHRRVHPTEESPAPLVVILRTNLSQFTVSTLVCHHRPLRRA